MPTVLRIAKPLLQSDAERIDAVPVAGCSGLEDDRVMLVAQPGRGPVSGPRLESGGPGVPWWKQILVRIAGRPISMEELR